MKDEPGAKTHGETGVNQYLPTLLEFGAMLLLWVLARGLARTVNRAGGGSGGGNPTGSPSPPAATTWKPNALSSPKN